MSEPIKYISKVEIKNLWGRYDIVWNLDPSVNILSGINGSGKSTFLDCIASIVISGSIHDETLREKISRIIITFDNRQVIAFERIKDTIKSLESRAKTDSNVKEFISKLKDDEGNNYRKINSIEFGMTSFGDNEMSIEKLHSYLTIDIVSTFDKPIDEKQNNRTFLNSSRGKKMEIKTELDKELEELENYYLDYQINIGKKAFEAVSKNRKNSRLEVLEVKKQHERLFEIIDILFSETDKKVDRENNELMFISGENKLTPYQLSSGEKQILLILVRVLIQDNKPAILLMDEPEISLHIDWQRKLIQYIKELNPNVQIILATHSPGIIMEGWADKVSEISDLIVFDRQAKLENAK